MQREPGTAERLHGGRDRKEERSNPSRSGCVYRFGAGTGIVLCLVVGAVVSIDDDDDVMAAPSLNGRLNQDESAPPPALEEEREVVSSWKGLPSANSPSASQLVGFEGGIPMRVGGSDVSNDDIKEKDEKDDEEGEVEEDNVGGDEQEMSEEGGVGAAGRDRFLMGEPMVVRIGSAGASGSSAPSMWTGEEEGEMSSGGGAEKGRL